MSATSVDSVKSYVAGEVGSNEAPAKSVSRLYTRVQDAPRMRYSSDV